MNDCMKKELRSNGVLLRLMKRMNIVRRYELDKMSFCLLVPSLLDLRLL